MWFKCFVVCFLVVFSCFISMVDNINGISGVFVFFVLIRIVVDFV